MKNDELMKLNLQFFADDGGDAGNNGSADDNNDNGSAAGNQTNPEENKAGEKTFTQEQLSAVAATEKKQGKQAILSIFGLKDEKSAKEQAKAFKEWQDSQKNAEQKLQEQQQNLNELMTRATQAENKLTCVTAGVTKDSIDDALAIASTKVTDDKDLAAVLEEMKKEPRYKGFFTADTGSSKGTGNPAGHSGGNAGSKGGSDNIGERLGKARAVEPKKSSYFSK